MRQAGATAELSKFAMLTAFWLGIIFGCVWVACWLVGVVIPALIDYNVANKAYALFWSNTFRALTPVVAVMVFIPINAMFMVLAERRALALFTQRKGPNRHGPDGYLQTAADAVKLLFKEDITPRGADAVMFTLAPVIFFAPSIIGLLPLLAAITGNNQLFAVANIPTGIFFVIAVSSIPVVGIVMGAWASNNKYSLVGGLRSVAQAVSYEVPLVLAIVTVCLMAGSLDVVQIVNRQAGGILHWNLFGGGTPGLLLTGSFAVAGGPLRYVPVSADGLLTACAFGLTVCLLLVFGIYAMAACAEVNRIPFDLPEAESELVSGYNTEYSGIKFAIFFLAEFTNLFIVCLIAAVMFLGGTHSPLPAAVDVAVIGWLENALKMLTTPAYPQAADLICSLVDPYTLWGALWIIVKVYFLVIFAILVRATLPRFRIDQLMDFGWKRLIPLSLILLVAVACLRVPFVGYLTE